MFVSWISLIMISRRKESDREAKLQEFYAQTGRMTAKDEWLKKSGR